MTTDDTDSPPSTGSGRKPPGNFGRNFFLGCTTLAVLSVVVPVGGWFYWDWTAKKALEEARVQQEAEAEQQFEPMMEALEQAAAPDAPYDIDKTVRVIHEIDRAMQKEQSLEEYLQWASRQDYSDVAPEVLEARREMLDVLMRLYAKQVQVEDQRAMWEVTSELLLATLSVVSVEGEANWVAPEAGLSVDQEQAKALLQELKDERADRQQLMEDIAEIETELMQSLVDYGDVYYKYIEEWDQLSVLRDRAYLAAHNGDWEQALAASELAIQQAPGEKEAHLLKAMALIEMDNRENAGEIMDVLEDYIEEHPDSTAPALLLMGVHQARMGDSRQANLSFQQSAAYYPKQAGKLTDMLNPYEMRSFLRQSREGQFIVELYKSTMLGSGYFSPDLQMAKARFDAGDLEGGRAKVLDHFARRRTQQQWDFIISDVAFCHDLLGPHFWEIFPEDTYLDLVASASMMGSSLNLSVNNRSPRTLHNATLVLAVQFTDMYAGDYEAIAAPETVPSIEPRSDTDFGSVEIAHRIFGKDKTVGDIVVHRAILISDEAVTWVDTNEYRIEKAEAFREQQRTREKLARAKPTPEPQLSHPLAKRHPEFQGTVDSLLEGVNQVAQVELESKYGADNLLVELPRELAILRPIFRLRYGDTLYEAQDNVIEGDRIQLRFAGVGNLDAEGAESPDDLELVMASPFGDVVFDWKNNGDLTWRFQGTQREDAGPEAVAPTP
jgi:tetratricopeptide (TPR) repeat protein